MIVAIKVAATVKLFVNLDKNLPGAQGELPALQLTFVDLEEAEAAAAVRAEEEKLKGPPDKKGERRRRGSDANSGGAGSRGASPAGMREEVPMLPVIGHGPVPE